MQPALHNACLLDATNNILWLCGGKDAVVRNLSAYKKKDKKIIRKHGQCQGEPLCLQLHQTAKSQTSGLR